MKATIISKLEGIEERHNEVSALLADAETIADQDRYRQLSMEYAQLTPVVNNFRAWQLARTITNKLIHAPTAGLKQASAEGRLDTVASARKLLGLEAPGQAEAPTVATEADEQGGFDLPPSTVDTSRRTLQ